jgi:hypothetical protein
VGDDPQRHGLLSNYLVKPTADQCGERIGTLTGTNTAG